MSKKLIDILQEQGFTDWASDPTTEERLPLLLGGNYLQANKLYNPKDIVIHIEKKGRLYVTTYIPTQDFNKHK
jgi:hypothetical protein